MGVPTHALLQAGRHQRGGPPGGAADGRGRVSHLYGGVHRDQKVYLWSPCLHHMLSQHEGVGEDPELPFMSRQPVPYAGRLLGQVDTGYRWVNIELCNN